jgi:hypothetical protein
MNEYVYQIQGVLEDSDGKLKGFRVMVCTLDNFDSADAPIEILDKETVKYIEFRLKACEYLNINRLPVGIQNKIRAPLGRWLDQWVLDNFYGNTSKSKGLNFRLLETSKQNPAR